MSRASQKMHQKRISYRKSRDRESLFYEQIKHLKSYRKKFPNKWPSQGAEFPPGNKLGGWVNSVRRGNVKITPERKEALDAIGFNWRPQEMKWLSTLTKVEIFINKNGRLPAVQKNGTNRESIMHHWLRLQVEKANEGKLPDFNKRALQKLGKTTGRSVLNPLEFKRQSFIKFYKAGGIEMGVS